MKKDYTRIAIILDRSGSMECLREATVAGYNEFIRSQRLVPGQCQVKLMQFDDRYQVVYDADVHRVPEMTQATFVPRGSTALLDAQGRTILELGAELSGMPETERPDRVIVCTITDGLENASKHYSCDAVRQMVIEQQTRYGWTFTYLGANQDAIQVGAMMGVPVSNSMTYASSPGAAKAMFRSVSAGMARVRSSPAPAAGGAHMNFTNEERARAMSTDGK